MNLQLTQLLAAFCLVQRLQLSRLGGVFRNKRNNLHFRDARQILCLLRGGSKHATPSLRFTRPPLSHACMRENASSLAREQMGLALELKYVIKKEVDHHIKQLRFYDRVTSGHICACWCELLFISQSSHSVASRRWSDQHKAEVRWSERSMMRALSAPSVIVLPHWSTFTNRKRVLSLRWPGQRFDHDQVLC